MKNGRVRSTLRVRQTKMRREKSASKPLSTKREGAHERLGDGLAMGQARSSFDHEDGDDSTWEFKSSMTSWSLFKHAEIRLEHLTEFWQTYGSFIFML
jgi:hypothetical protein